MKVVEFINPHNHAIELRGPSQERIRLKKGEKKVLSEWYMKYSPKYIKPINSRNIQGNVKTIRVKKSVVVGDIKDKNKPAKKSRLEREKNNGYVRGKRKTRTDQRRQKTARAKSGVGTRNKRFRVHENPKLITQYYNKLNELCRIHESNDIGIGILSYNRLGCIKSILGSIRKYTDLTKITVIVSDESTKPEVKQWLSNQKDIVFLNNKDRLGVAGNTNRLLRCLERFKYKLILNDDVEIVSKGWEQVYFSIMEETGYHHFCMRQPGVYGANRKDGKVSTVKDLEVQTVTVKPHGAVLAFDDVAFKKVGFFDEGYGKYGLEHVDWSNRVSLSGIQPVGFHDVLGTEKFFKIDNRATSIPQAEKSKGISEARKKYNSHKTNKSRIYIKPTDRSKVPGVTFVLPFPVRSKQGNLSRVINNIKSLDYPRIEIIVAGDDINKGVAEAKTGIVFIHDADLLCEFDYIRIAMRVLRMFDAAHLGKNIIYLNASNNPCKMVTGFVDGSIICRKVKFTEAGGFGDDFYSKIGNLNSFFSGDLVNFVRLH